MSRPWTPTKLRKNAKKSCARKMAYETEAAAVEAGEAAERDGIMGGKSWNAYSCRFCGMYHWGRIGPLTGLIDKAFERRASA